MKANYSPVNKCFINILISMKKLNFISKLFFSGIVFLLFLTRCSDETPKGEYEDGVYIVNEGTNENGSISFYNYGSDEVFNQVFKTKNERVLGTFVQSMKLHHDNAYIVVNGSNKVEVVNRYTMEEKGVIDEVSSPRYIETKGNKGYVSCWTDNSVKIVDLETFTVTKTLPVASGPEKMLIKGNSLYVVNSGGWSYDSIVSVIDLNSEEVIKSIQVAYTPMDIVEDKSGNIWVLCAGKTVYNWEPPYNLLEESPSKVVKIDPATNEVVLEISLFADQHPNCLETDNEAENLYFGGGYAFTGIYKLDVSSVQPVATEIVKDMVYGFNIDKETDVIFACISTDFTKSGTLKRYDLNGSELGTYTVGIGPNGTALKKAN